MQEMEDIISGKVEAKGYTDVDEMFRDILSEEGEQRPPAERQFQGIS